jgi:hypothetical protein
MAGTSIQSTNIRSVCVKDPVSADFAQLFLLYQLAKINTFEKNAVTLFTLTFTV